MPQLPNFGLLTPAIVVWLTGSIPIPTFAATTESESNQTEVETVQLQRWLDQPSSSTSPVDLRIGSQNYRVPRNYIVWLDRWNGGQQTLVTFKVTFPGLKGFNETTEACLTHAPLYRPPGCVPIEFMVRGGSTADPTDEEGFQNLQSVFNSKVPRVGVAGFQVYESGPPNARMETYRKQTDQHALIINCYLGSTDVPHVPICTNHSRLADGNVLEYHIYYDQLRDVEQIDDGVRGLIASFRASGEQK